MPLGELDRMAAFPSEAERMQRAMVERRTAEFGPDHVLTLKGVLKLAQTLKRSTDSELLNEAKVLLQRCINGLEEPEGENGENKLLAMNCLAQVMSKLGRDDEAEALFRRTLQGREATLGPHHPDTLITVNNLGLLLEARDHTNAIGSDADKMFRRALPFTPRDITTDPN